MTLLSPATWEDRNDAYYLERYQTNQKLKTVLAACFSNKRETFHHWKVFASRSSGVCIEFDRDPFLEEIVGDPLYRSQDVEYRTIKQLRKSPPPIDEWPFLKRHAFRDEGEFRIVYENKHAAKSTKSFDFSISAINRITLSPWMPSPVAESVKKVIKGMNHCSEVVVHHSTLVDNDTWKAMVHTQ